MNAICRRIQDTVATEGAQVLQNDEEAQRHAAESSDCFTVSEGLNELDERLEALPRIDAPDDVVERPGTSDARTPRTTSPGRSMVPVRVALGSWLVTITGWNSGRRRTGADATADSH